MSNAVGGQAGSSGQAAGGARKGSKLKWILIAAAVLLPVAAVAGARLYYNDGYIKGEIEKALSEKLGREVKIGSFELSILGGTATLQDLVVPNKEPGFESPETFKLGRVNVSGPLLAIGWNGGKQADGLKIEIVKPELIIERRQRGGADYTNLDDILAKFKEGKPAPWPKETGLEKLGAEVTVREGIVRFRDPARQLGESRAENIALTAAQPGLGEKLALKLGFKLVTPQTPGGGGFDAAGGMQWIDAQGRIPHPGQFKDLALDAKLDACDLPFLTRHLGLSVLVMDRRLETTLGRPVTGTLKLEAADFAQAKLAARFDTPGLISLWEKGVLKAGQLAARVEAEGHGALNEGALKLQSFKAQALLGPTLDALGSKDLRGLDLDVDFAGAAGKPPVLAVKLTSNLEKLLGTDIGAALQLKDKLGGVLAAEGTSSTDAQGRWHTVGTFRTDKAYVAVDGLKQPTTAEASFDTSIALDKDGNPDQGEAIFACKGNAFELGTDGPLRLAGLNDAAKLSVQGTVNYVIRGRELWQEFGPLLAVFNLGKPLAEELRGKAAITGTPGRLNIGLDTTLARQSEPKQELRLNASVDYDGNALVAAAGAPYLAFKVLLKSARDKSLNFTAEGTSARHADRFETTVPAMQFTGALEALKGLAQRFDAYVGALPEKGVSAAGTVQLNGNAKLARKVGAKGEELSSELTSLAELRVFNFDLQAPPPAEGKPPVRWQEAEASLRAELAQRSDANGARLDVKNLKLASTTLNVEGNIEGADSARLAYALEGRPLDVKLLLAALPKIALKAVATPEAVTRIQALGLLPNEPAAAGTVTCEASFDARDRTLHLALLAFKSDALSVTIETQKLPEASVIALAEGALGSEAQLKAALLQHLPDAMLDMQVLPGALDALRRLKLLDAGLALKGDGRLKARYDRKDDRLYVENLQFARTEGAVSAVHRLALTGEFAQASKLLLNPPADPAALTAHLDKGLDLIELKVDADALLRFTQTLKLGGAAVNDALAGVYAARDLALNNVKVRQGAAPGTLEAVFAAQANVRHHPRPAPNASPSSEAQAYAEGVIETDPAAPLLLDFNGGRVAVKGALRFDKAALYCAAAKPYIYKKAAGAPCRLTVDAAQEADGTVKIALLEAEGGPAQAKVTGLAYKDRAEGAVLTLRSAELSEPLAVTLTGLTMDAGADRLSFAFSGPELAWAKVSPYLALPASLRVSGSARNVDLRYDGRLSGLSKGFGAEDKLSLRAEFNGLALDGYAGDKRVLWVLTGSVNADGRLLTSKGLTAEITCQAAGSPAVRQQLACTLEVTGRDGLPLLDALKADGLPLNVVVPVESRTAFDLTGVLDAIGALADAASGTTPAKTAGDMSGIRKLRVEVPRVNVPKLLLNGLVLERIKVPGNPRQTAPAVVFDKLLVDIPSASCEMYGGTVWVQNGRFDLSRMPREPIGFNTEFTLQDVELAQLTASSTPPTKDAYAISGRLTAQGTLKGWGFNGAERRSWNGNLTAEVENLLARNPGRAKGGGFGDQAKKMGIGVLGGLLGGSTTKTATRLYASDFGLNLGELAFETFTVKAAIRNGVAVLDRSQVVARGDNAGLKLPFEGRIDAATEAFAPNMVLWPAEIPATTQRLLDLDKLYERDRTSILRDFADGQYKVVLEGSLAAMKDNRYALIAKFDALAARIDQMLAQKARDEAAARAAQQQPPPQNNPPPANNPPPPANNPPPPAPNPPAPK